MLLLTKGGHEQRCRATAQGRPAQRAPPLAQLRHPGCPGWVSPPSCCASYLDRAWADGAATHSWPLEVTAGHTGHRFSSPTSSPSASPAHVTCSLSLPSITKGEATALSCWEGWWLMVSVVLAFPLLETFHSASAFWEQGPDSLTGRARLPQSWASCHLLSCSCRCPSPAGKCSLGCGGSSREPHPPSTSPKPLALGVTSFLQPL